MSTSSTTTTRIAMQAAAASSGNDQVADELGLLARIQSMRFKALLDALCNALRRQGASLPYPPAGYVLRTLLSMFKLTNRNGWWTVRHPERFTKSNHRITSRQEIIDTCWELEHYQLSDDKVDRALKVLTDAGIIHRFKGQWRKKRCALYFKFNVFVFWDLLRMDVRVPDAVDKSLVRQFPIANQELLKQLQSRGEIDQVQTRRSAALFIPDCIAASFFPGNDPAPQESIAHESGFVAIPSGNLNEGAGCAGGSSKNQRQYPGKGFGHVDPVSGTAQFYLSRQQAKIIDFIEAHPLFLDKQNTHNPVKLAAEQVKGLILLIEREKLSLTWLRRYYGAITGTPGMQVTGSVPDTWWLRLSVDAFLKFFRVVRQILKREQVQVSQEQFQSAYVSPFDLDRAYAAVLCCINAFLVEIGYHTGEAGVIRALTLRSDCQVPNSGFPYRAVFFAQLFRPELDRLSPGLAQEIIEHHLCAAQYELRNEFFVDYAAMRHAKIDVASWFGLTPAMIADVEEKLQKFKTAYALQQQMLMA